MKNQDWANYVKERRKARQLTRRKLAELAKIEEEERRSDYPSLEELMPELQN